MPSRLPRAARRLAAVAALVLSPLVGCERTPAPPPRSGPVDVAAKAERERAPATITLLYTTDEHGWLQPVAEEGKVKGGAAQVLALWIAEEGHCPGLPADGSAAPGPIPAACKDPATLALSGGDNWTGPALSSYFQGAPMAEAMRRMGYAASAFGNHEFDFGRDAFLQNRARARLPYLAANLRVRGPGLQALEIPPFVIFERRGVRIGVIGLATQETLRTAMASRFEGIEFLEEEEALERAVPEAWRAEPDAVVLIAHECPDKLAPILDRHPEWGLSFVGGGHCHKQSNAKVGDALLVNPSWRLRSYARVRLEIDPRRPLRRRVVSTSAEIVDVAPAEGAPAAPPDEPIARSIAAWQARLDEALGETIGYSDGMERGSTEIGQWIGAAWRDELGVDMALLNKGGIRQAVPRGPVTKATIYSVLPFDNKLLICSLKGSDVLQLIGHAETVLAGLSPAGGGRYVLGDGKPFEEARRYTVATIDFLYFGGDGFGFQAQDPNPSWTGLDWRAPVISWTKAMGTSPNLPLERLVR